MRVVGRFCVSRAVPGAELLGKSLGDARLVRGGRFVVVFTHGDGVVGVVQTVVQRERPEAERRLRAALCRSRWRWLLPLSVSALSRLYPPAPPPG